MSRTLDCMIVGAQKCGTTSLKEYLAEHPGVVTHPRMEFTAFGQGEYSEQLKNEELGKLLRAAADRLALAKDAVLYTEPFGLDRLRESSPDCKVVLSVRDPVARAHSAFKNYARLGDTSASFEDVVGRAIERGRDGSPASDLSSTLLYMGCYGKWLGEILRHFSKENVKVIFLEQFKKDPTSSYGDLCVWLGLDPGFSPNLNVRHNIGGDPKSALVARAMKRLRSERNPAKRAMRRALPEETYVRFTERVKTMNRSANAGESGSTPIDDRLRQYFEKDSEEFSRLLGVEVPWLSVAGSP